MDRQAATQRKLELHKPPVILTQAVTHVRPFEPSWTCIGPVLEHLGPVLGYLGPVLGHFRPFLGDISPGLGPLERVIEGVTEGVTEVELRVTEVTGPLFRLTGLL